MGQGQPVVAEGMIEGTGAALNISCGFIPKSVDVFNVDGLATLSWVDSLGDGHGAKRVTAGTLTHITSGGITPYEGASSAGQALQGTITGSAGSSVLTGSSTFFTEELLADQTSGVIGDIIEVGNQRRRVVAIASNTSLTLDQPLEVAVSAVTGYRLTRADQGFTLGTDADMNVNGETLYWRAFR